MGIEMIGGMLLFWVVLIVLAVLLVRGLFQSDGRKEAGSHPTAHQILEERYARGEINREQYQMMLKDLE